MKRLFPYLAKKFFKKEYLFLQSKLRKLYNSKVYLLEREGIYNLELMLIVAEDHRFCDHFGFDIKAIVRAVRNRIFFCRIEGASTIEQQLTRVLTNQYQRTLSRKIKEIFLATTIVEVVPRAHIPLMYLKNAYYGHDTYGYGNLLQKMHKLPGIIDLNIAAEVVSRIKYPESGKNHKRLSQIERRKAYLIKRFEKLNGKHLIKFL